MPYTLQVSLLQCKDSILAGPVYRYFPYKVWVEARTYVKSPTGRDVFLFPSFPVSLNGADTRQRVEEPFINLPHHKVIPRRTLPRVPLLGQRGSSEFQLETIAGCFFMVVHGVHQFIQPVTRQSLEQITVTHITGGQPVAVAFYIRYQIIKHRLSVIGGNHSQEQRQGIAALASRTILTSVLVIKLPMECFIDFFTQ